MIRCPDWPDPTVTGPQVFGCGSTNLDGPDDEGLYDCRDCGMWFFPEPEPASDPATVGYQGKTTSEKRRRS